MPESQRNASNRLEPPPRDGAQVPPVVETAPTGTTIATNPHWRLTTAEVYGCSVAICLWIGLIAAGVSIDTPKYMTLLETPQITGFTRTLGCAFVVFTCHVVPNVALLSCLAAYLGAIGSRTLPKENRADHSPVDHRATYAIAITRGFYVYLIIMSGSVLTSSQGFGEWPDPAKPGTSYETYTRLAGMTSLISFTAGFNPDLFRRLLSRFGGGPADPAQPPSTPASGG